MRQERITCHGELLAKRAAGEGMWVFLSLPPIRNFACSLHPQATFTYIPWYIVHIEMSATAIEKYVENYYGNLNKVIWNEVLRVGN